MVYFLGALSSLPASKAECKRNYVEGLEQPEGHEVPGEHSKHLKGDISVSKSLVGPAVGEFSPESAHHPAGVG